MQISQRDGSREKGKPFPGCCLRAKSMEDFSMSKRKLSSPPAARAARGELKMHTMWLAKRVPCGGRDYHHVTLSPLSPPPLLTRSATGIRFGLSLQLICDTFAIYSDSICIIPNHIEFRVQFVVNTLYSMPYYIAHTYTYIHAYICTLFIVCARLYFTFMQM